MRAASRDDYLKRIDRVVEALSSSIGNEQPLPSVGALARHANLSEFHFMRVYRALAGEALGGTIQRLRLQRAAHLLIQTTQPIVEVSGRAGYETPQAFAKAFRRMFGVTPSDFREQPQTHVIAAAVVLSAPERQPVIRVEIVELRPFRVAALRNHGAYADLDRAYAQLFSWMAKRGALETMDGIWGAPHHDRRDSPEEDCVFDCYLSNPADLADGEGVRMTQIGGGRYVVCRHVGSYDLLDEVHDTVLRYVLFTRGMQLRAAPILHQYLNDPECTPEEALESLIHVPVE